MPRGTTWNYRGEYETSAAKYEGQWSFEDERPCPPELVSELTRIFTADLSEEHCITLRIPYNREGYYDPGICSGPPERCYPPEGDDEITLDGQATAELKGLVHVTALNKEASEKLLDLFLERIEHTTVQPYDPSDRED